MNAIHIYEGHHPRQRTIHVKSPFFELKKDFIVRVDHEKITFLKPTLGHTGKTYKLNPTQCGWGSLTIVADLPVCSHLQFDPEESNEDKIVVYYNEQGSVT